MKPGTTDYIHERYGTRPTRHVNLDWLYLQLPYAMIVFRGGREVLIDDARETSTFGPLDDLDIEAVCDIVDDELRRRLRTWTEALDGK